MSHRVPVPLFYRDMKKLLYILGIVTIAACSSDEEYPQTIYPTGNSEHTITNFVGTLRFNSTEEQWELGFNRDQDNPFVGSGEDEVGAIVLVENMQDDYKQYEGQQVIVSGSYKYLHMIVYKAGVGPWLRYYSLKIEQISPAVSPVVPEPVKIPSKNRVAKMTITTDGGAKVDSKDKANYRACTIKIESDTAVWNYEGRGRIRGRGNSTWEWYAKKPYRIKLDEKAEILGLAADKDWVLLANYRDPTNLMNAFVFEMGAGLGIPYPNHTRFVELTINGDYKGLYQLTEQVEQGKNRVNIDKNEGLLIALDVDDGPAESPDADDNFWSQVYRLPVCVKSGSFDLAREELATLESVIKSHDYEALSKVMNIPVMIDYLLIQEFIYNVEVAAPRSIFLHKDVDGLWTYGPLWDFDAGFDFDWGQMTTGHQFFKDYRETVLGTDPAHHISDYTYTSSFFTDMWKNKQFVSEVKARWKQIRPRIMGEFWPETKRYAEAAAEAMERDAQRWPIDKQYQTEINRMEKWLNSRTIYMDNIVSGYPGGN